MMSYRIDIDLISWEKPMQILREVFIKTDVLLRKCFRKNVYSYNIGSFGWGNISIGMARGLEGIPVMWEIFFSGLLHILYIFYTAVRLCRIRKHWAHLPWNAISQTLPLANHGLAGHNSKWGFSHADRKLPGGPGSELACSLLQAHLHYGTCAVL